MRSWMVLTAGALALVLWSGLIVWWLGAGAPRVSTAHAVVKATASSASAEPIAALELRAVDGGLLLSGEVPSAVIATELLSKARVMYAPQKVDDGLRVRPAAERSAWLAQALAGLPLPMPGIERPEWLLSAEGLRVGGVAADAVARDAVHAQTAQRFPELPRAVHVQLLQPAAAAPVTPAAPAAVDTPAPDVAAETAASVTPELSASAHPRQAEVDALLAARPVVFASGSTRLQRGSGPDWRALASLLAEAGVAVAVRGHTDDRGSAAGNQRLSARRAESVRQALVDAGLPADRIRAEGVGEAEPVASNSTAAGRRQNRRIEIRLLAEVGR